MREGEGKKERVRGSDLVSAYDKDLWECLLSAEDCQSLRPFHLPHYFQYGSPLGSKHEHKVRNALCIEILAQEEEDDEEAGLSMRMGYYFL